MVIQDSYTTETGNFNLLLHKDFPHISFPSKSSTRQCRSKTKETDNSSEHYTIQKIVFSALWVQLTLVICYLSYFMFTVYLAAHLSVYLSLYIPLELLATLVFLSRHVH